MIQLLSTDFDGTLVNHNRQPSVEPRLFLALQDLRKQGVKWAVNTGRTLWHLEEGLKKEFCFPIQPDFAIVEEREIYRRTRGGGWEPLGEWNRKADQDHAELFQMAGPIIAEILTFTEALDGAQAIHDRGRFVGAVTKTNEQMDRLCHFLDQMRKRIHRFSYQRNTVYVRFCHEDYSKGSALGELARMLGIGRDAVFAAGDHYNDLAMLDGKFAAHVMCPSNACEEVKLTVRMAGGFLAKGEASVGVLEAMAHYGVWPVAK